MLDLKINKIKHYKIKLIIKGARMIIECYKNCILCDNNCTEFTNVMQYQWLYSFKAS